MKRCHQTAIKLDSDLQKGQEASQTVEIGSINLSELEASADFDADVNVREQGKVEEPATVLTNTFDSNHIEMINQIDSVDVAAENSVSEDYVKQVNNKQRPNMNKVRPQIIDDLTCISEDDQ